MADDDRSLKLPAGLFERARALCAIRSLGFTSPTEFCKDAIRRRLEDLERQWADHPDYGASDELRASTAWRSRTD